MTWNAYSISEEGWVRGKEQVSIVDFMEAVAWFRKHGMQAERIRLCRFHWGFMEMFDGEFEEAEKIFDRITGWAG